MRTYDAAIVSGVDRTGRSARRSTRASKPGTLRAPGGRAPRVDPHHGHFGSDVRRPQASQYKAASLIQKRGTRRPLLRSAHKPVSAFGGLPELGPGTFPEDGSLESGR